MAEKTKTTKAKQDRASAEMREEMFAVEFVRLNGKGTRAAINAGYSTYPRMFKRAVC